MKNIIKTMLSDISYTVFSSKRRAIKILGVLITPILYAIICILAFWNPIANIGKTSIGIIDSDSDSGIVSALKINQIKNDDGTDEIKYTSNFYDASNQYKVLLNEQDFNYLYSFASLKQAQNLNFYYNDGTNLNLSYLSSDQDADKIYDSVKAYLNTDQDIIILKDNSGVVGQYYTFTSSIFSTMGKMLMSSDVFKIEKQGNSIENTTYGIDIPSGDDVLKFSDIHYVAHASSEKKYKSYDYKMQLHFSDGFTSNMISDLSNILNSLSNLSKNFGNFINGFQKLIADMKGFDLYTSYAHGFIFGVFMTTIKNFDFALVASIINQIGDKTNITIQNYDSVTKLLDDSDIDFSQLAKIINFNILQPISEAKSDILIYGFGLGQLFILIGLSAGTIAQTFFFDRAKRICYAKSWQWFGGKVFTLGVIGICQMILLTIAFTSIGWYELGFVKIISLYFWWTFILLIIIFCFTSMWFISRSEAVGRWFMLVYVVVNVIAGWGSFPTFMMNKFFDILSYITIYRWSNNITSMIMYANNINWILIAKALGCLILICLFFGTIGILLSKKRYRDVHYGSSNGKFVINAIGKFGLDADEFYLNKKDMLINNCKYKIENLKNSVNLHIQLNYLNQQLDFYNKNINEENDLFIKKTIKKLNYKIEKVTKLLEIENQDVIKMKIKKIHKKIEIIENKNMKNKMIYNWNYLDNCVNLDYLNLNKAVNEKNPSYIGFNANYDAKNDFNILLPDISDNELITRND